MNNENCANCKKYRKIIQDMKHKNISKEHGFKLMKHLYETQTKIIESLKNKIISIEKKLRL